MPSVLFSRAAAKLFEAAAENKKHKHDCQEKRIQSAFLTAAERKIRTNAKKVNENASGREKTKNSDKNHKKKTLKTKIPQC